MNTPPNGREGHAHPLDGSAAAEASTREEQLSLALPGDEEGSAAPPAISNADDAEMAAAIEQGEALIDAPIDATAEQQDAEPLPEPVLVSELPEFVSAPAIVVTERESLGTRLKRSRELQGIAIEDVAKRLRIPAARLVELESDAYDRISAPIYLRGYLKSYARLLGLPDVVVTAALQDVALAPPALVATQTVSRSRYLASRYGNPVVYAVLTAVVVVPLLWAARQGSLMPQAEPRLEALDAAPNAVTATPATAAGRESARTPGSGSDDPIAMGPPAPAAVPPIVAPPAAAPEERRPVMAAMTPMPSAPSYPAPAARQVTLTLAQASWIELIGADGSRIEYALLPAGTTKSYAIAGNANLRIGNTRGAALTIDGAAVELAPYTRSNVARVAIGPTEG